MLKNNYMFTIYNKNNTITTLPAHAACCNLEKYTLVHVSLESKNSLDLNTVRNNVKMVRF